MVCTGSCGNTLACLNETVDERDAVSKQAIRLDSWQYRYKGCKS